MKRILLPAALVTLAIAATLPGPAPRFDSWTIIGPGGAGAMFPPTISPHDSNVVLEYSRSLVQDGFQAWHQNVVPRSSPSSQSG